MKTFINTLAIVITLASCSFSKEVREVNFLKGAFKVKMGDTISMCIVENKMIVTQYVTNQSPKLKNKYLFIVR